MAKKILSPTQLRKMQEDNLEAAKQRLFKLIFKGFKSNDMDNFVEQISKAKEVELFINGEKIKAAEKITRGKKEENLNENSNTNNNFSN